MAHYRYHSPRINLSPWCRAVAGDLTGLTLPRGYFITGLARSGAGPWTLKLHSPGTWQVPSTVLAEHEMVDADDVRPRLLSLVDIAAIHEHERNARVVVTADREGYVRSIEDA